MKNIEALDDIFLHRGSNSSWANHTDLTGDWVAEKQNKTKNLPNCSLSPFLDNNSLGTLNDSRRCLLLSYSAGKPWNSNFVSLVLSDPEKLRRWIRVLASFFLKYI